VVFIIDSHLDLAWNALNWNRDLTLSIAEIRRSEAGMTDPRRGHNTVSLPEMHKGEVIVCLATILSRSSGQGVPLLDFRSRELAWAMSQGQLAFYRLMESTRRMRMIKDRRTLTAHVEEWIDAGRDRRAGAPLGFILAMEGADPILSPRDVAQWWAAGLRVLEPVHYGVTAYAHGTGSAGGLTPQGRDLLMAMAECGMVLDVTHLADEAFSQALTAFRGRVLASHHNCRALVPGQRQLTDEQIRALIGRRAVIGAACDAWMLHPDYVPSQTPRSLIGLDAVVDHIDHVCQLAGNARHAAIGSDLDGGFGTEQSPRDLDTIADLQKIPALLSKRGYSASDVEGVMWRNWFEFFYDALPE